ncbi:MAG: hypothetical protein Q9195_006709 [Heterodermia aff. obscurata]
MPREHRILFIDAYDSFSHNIIALLEQISRVKVTKITIDAVILDLEDFLSSFSAVVCGPGPGHPAVIEDVGLMNRIWKLPDSRLIPVLGICLGFQSLVHEFGASVVRLQQPRHGIKTTITSSSKSIFEGLPCVDAVQYHSLHAFTGHDVSPASGKNGLWMPSELCPQLEPLAWDLSSQDNDESNFRTNPAAILMAAKHITKPFYGVQFHPESICSEASAVQIVANWWKMAGMWSSSLKTKPGAMVTLDSNTSTRPNSLCTSIPTTPATSVGTRTSRNSQSYLKEILDSKPEGMKPNLISTHVPIGVLNVPTICEAMDLPATDMIVFDSEMHQLPQLAETSIVGIILPDTKKIQYRVGSNEAYVLSERMSERIDLKDYDDDIFCYLQDFMSGLTIQVDNDRAFSAGLMGYIAYEACLETIGVNTRKSSGHPDISFAFIERSILIDHKHQLLYVQALRHDTPDSSTSHWVSKTSSFLESLSQKSTSSSGVDSLSLATGGLQRNLPKESEYKSKIAHCQDEISAGESYELCLTDQTSISMVENVSAWSMYKQLRALNPSTFGAFVRLGPLTLLSTSPERFMKWSRFEKSPDTMAQKIGFGEQIATCQFRPMKGTVRKYQTQPDGSTHQLSRDEATAILATPKEQAENLMIVDLIRHDLQGVCHDVSVPGLMVVEEYGSVYQLVSVIEGKMSKSFMCGLYDGKCGIECLAASLPPGSMTGAPKKRSCELLEKIEKKPRSVYSGVLGYIDVSGKGDFSVIIRSMYKWDDECHHSGATWHIGAGGAITTLSSEEGEWQEMLTKLRSTYRLFDPVIS